jgi:hypothetical protein
MPPRSTLGRLRRRPPERAEAERACVCTDGGADAVALDPTDLRQARERHCEGVGRGFGRRSGMAYRSADRAILGGDAGDHRIDRLADRVAGSDRLRLALGELENGQSGVVGQASRRAAMGDERVPQRRADPAGGVGSLNGRAPAAIATAACRTQRPTPKLTVCVSTTVTGIGVSPAASAAAPAVPETRASRWIERTSDAPSPAARAQVSRKAPGLGCDVVTRAPSLMRA